MPIALFLAWSALSFFYSANRFYTMESFLHLICGVFIFFIVTRKVTDVRKASAVLSWIAAGGVVVGIFGVLDFFHKDVFPWDALVENRWYSLWGGIKPPFKERMMWQNYFSGRTSSSFGNPVYVAGYLLMMLPVCFALFFGSRGKFKKIMFIFLFIFLFFNLILTFTRGAWLCFIVTLPVMFVLMRGERLVGAVRMNRRWLAAAVVLCVVIVVMFSVKSRVNPHTFTVVERVRSLADLKDESMLQRWLIWKTAWHIAVDRPLLGVGLGNFQIHYPLYQKEFLRDERWLAHASFPDSVHNEYLEIFCERGLPGLAIFMWFLVMIFCCGVRGVRGGGSDKKWLSAGLVAGVFSVCLYGVTQFPFRIIPVWVLFCMFSGMLVGMNTGIKEELPPPALARVRKNMGAGGRYMFMVLFGVFLILLCAAASAPLRANVLAYWGIRSYNKAGLEMQALGLLERAAALLPYDREILFYLSSTLLKEAHKAGEPETKAMFFRRAGQVLIHANSMNPNDTLVLNDLANVHLNLGDADNAIRIYKGVTELEPYPALAYYNMGIAYQQKKMYNEAIKSYRRSLEIDADNTLAYYNLGKAFTAVGRVDAAEKAYLKGLKSEPESAELLNTLGQLYDGQGRLGQAVSCYRKAIKYDPAYDSAFGNLSITLIKKGEHREAIEVLSSLIKRDTRSAIAYYYLGEAYRGAGDEGQAVSAYRRAAELEPGNVLYQDVLQKKGSSWQMDKKDYTRFR
ncbi:MAG: tetratricopeptide repeat protein [bacterium]